MEPGLLTNMDRLLADGFFQRNFGQVTLPGCLLRLAEPAASWAKTKPL